MMVQILMEPTKNGLEMLVLRTPSLTLVADLRRQRWTLHDNATGYRMLVTSNLVLLRPVFDDQPIPLVFQHAEQQHVDDVTLVFTSEGVGEFSLRLSADVKADAIDLSCTFIPVTATQLNRLELFPVGTLVTAYDVVNFRHRHHTTATYPELLLGGTGCSTNTFSEDWQFAPHPSMLLFRKAQASLFVGAFDLPKAFGIYFSAHRHRIDTWHLDYGEAPYGQTLAAEEEFRSPRFRMFLRQEQSVAAMLDIFADMLIREGIIANPALKKREAWWQEPLYCTWIDQTLLSGQLIPSELKAQADMQVNRSVGEILNEDMVRSAAAVIARERLPFRTILLDEGWQVARGQWEPHPQRFPDLRGLVDELHALGLKVVVWWSWAEIDDEAEINPAHLIGEGKRNRHGSRMRDYSLPATQEEYLKPLFHRLFSSDEGCYDLDGVKTDFLADKVHADMPVADSAWRGEENYFVQLTKLFHNEMCRHKPDAVHIGCAGHFWLAEEIDINRTYDDFSSNYLVHEARAQMLRHTTPGCPVAYDFHTMLENMVQYFAMAREHAASVQIGNILYIRDDGFSVPRPADDNYYSLLRHWLPLVTPCPKDTSRYAPATQQGEEHE